MPISLFAVALLKKNFTMMSTDLNAHQTNNEVEELHSRERVTTLIMNLWIALMSALDAEFKPSKKPLHRVFNPRNKLNI